MERVQTDQQTDKQTDRERVQTDQQTDRERVQTDQQIDRGRDGEGTDRPADRQGQRWRGYRQTSR